MAVNAITKSIGESIVKELNNNTTEEDLDKIEREIKNNGKEMTAQQIADKYDISISEAKQILKDIETSDNKNSTQNVVIPRKIEPEEGSTVTYEA